METNMPHTHPGQTIKHDCLADLRLSIKDAATHLGVDRSTLSRVINGHAGISAEMAIGLEKAGWSNPKHWLRLQTAYDLDQARQHEEDIHVERFESPTS